MRTCTNIGSKTTLIPTRRTKKREKAADPDAAFASAKDRSELSSLVSEASLSQLPVSKRPQALLPSVVFTDRHAVNPRINNSATAKLKTRGGDSSCEKRSLDAAVRDLRFSFKHLCC